MKCKSFAKVFRGASKNSEFESGFLIFRGVFLGSRQVVRHRILIPAFVGSIPTSPASFQVMFLIL
jgi:hypothetical protein